MHMNDSNDSHWSESIGWFVGRAVLSPICLVVVSGCATANGPIEPSDARLGVRQVQERIVKRLDRDQPNSFDTCLQASAAARRGVAKPVVLTWRIDGEGRVKHARALPQKGYSEESLKCLERTLEEVRFERRTRQDLYVSYPILL